jgi:hypothetical protein
VWDRGQLIRVGTGMAVFTRYLCAFPRSNKGTFDNQIMDTNDVHFLRHRAHRGDNIGQPRTLSLIARSFRSAIEAALAAMRDWFRGWGESTQLGPVPEQIIGRKTGART